MLFAKLTNKNIAKFINIIKYDSRNQQIFIYLLHSLIQIDVRHKTEFMSQIISAGFAEFNADAVNTNLLSIFDQICCHIMHSLLTERVFSKLNFLHFALSLLTITISI